MVSISGHTKLFGLLSQNAPFTLSPLIHNYAAQQLKKDQIYVNFDIDPKHVKDFLNSFWNMGGLGLNVTMPHKNQVATLVPSNGLTSVNTLVRTESGWHGYSTDGKGFKSSLKRAGRSLSDFKTIIILGNGGAAQSIVSEVSICDNAQPNMIIVHRRSKLNDHKILEGIKGQSVHFLTFRSLDPESFADSLISSAGNPRLIIQATNAPYFGDDFKSYRNSLSLLNKDDCFVDLIYDKPSAMFHECIRLGLNCLDGLPMLIEQARLSQMLWWNDCSSYDDLYTEIKKTGQR